jgi:hypothetical protein
MRKLSDDEKRILKLFIWAGCGCHKDLNTVHGGNTAMMTWWKENQVEPPVLLANRCAVKCGVATELCSKCYCQSSTEGLDVSATQLKGEQGIGRGW